MNDQQLADALVERGIGNREPVSYEYYYAGFALPADKFVRDWRVAGACLERMPDGAFVNNCGCFFEGSCEMEYSWLKDPRAICLAFVEAMSDG